MVLVSDKPSNDIGILQTKLSDRERHETRRVGLEAMPLDEDIEGRHGEGEARLKIGPAPMHDLFHMADERQHREHRLDEHTVLPLATRTQFEVGQTWPRHTCHPWGLKTTGFGREIVAPPDRKPLIFQLCNNFGTSKYALKTRQA